MNTEKDRKELHDESNQVEPEDDKNTGPVTNITPHVTNPSPEIILIWRIRSSHDDDDDVPREERERRKGIITSLVTIANSKVGGLVCDLLLKYGSTTLQEVEYSIPTKRGTASRILKGLWICGVVEKVGYVESPYRLRNTPGPRSVIFSLKGADPQAAIEAQERYGDLVVKARDLTLELERQQREAQNEAQALEAKNLVEAQALEIQDLAGQVFDDLPRPFTMRSTPIYDAMNRVGVDTTLRKDVIAGVLRRIQEVGV